MLKQESVGSASAGPAGPAVVVRGLKRSFAHPAGAVEVLRGVDLSVPAGSFTCIRGSSGSGKTTLLMTLAGIEPVQEGSVQVLGHRLDGASERERAHWRLNELGVVFQDHHLLPDLTAIENVELVLGERRPRITGIAEAAHEALARVGLADLGHRFPHELSGGQQQRVGIARALAGGKPLLLADEPTGALDRTNSRALFELLAELTHNQGITAIVCTHDESAAEHASERLALVDGLLEQW